TRPRADHSTTRYPYTTLFRSGAGTDTIHGNDGNDLILGDSGTIDYVGGGVVDGVVNQVLSTTEAIGGADTITGDLGDDTILGGRSEEHTYELQSQSKLVCRLL